MSLNFCISFLECHSETSSSLSPYSDCTSPRPSHRVTSPLLTPYSDITSSSSDCDSELDQVSTHPEQPPRKKRQRTIFSRDEVLELEEAFKRRPYLTAYDYEELGQRLGIPTKSVKVSWHLIMLYNVKGSHEIFAHLLSQEHNRRVWHLAFSSMRVND